METFFTTAKAQDFDEVFALYKSLRGMKGCVWSDYYPTAELVMSDIKEQNLFVLKDKNDKLISAVFAGFEDEFQHLEWNTQNPCYLARFAVSREHQNKGMAKLMLKKVIEASKNRGFKSIRLLVHEENYPALSMYIKQGFKIIERIFIYENNYYRMEISI